MAAWVLSLISSTAQLGKLLDQQANDSKDANEEISRLADALKSLAFVLEQCQTLLMSDNSVGRSISNSLATPLASCESALRDLHLRISKVYESRKKGRGFVARVKWSLGLRQEMENAAQSIRQEIIQLLLLL